MIFTFKVLMIVTFLAAVGVLITGVFGMGIHQKDAKKNKSNRLMVARVLICLTLLIEMVVYATFIR